MNVKCLAVLVAATFVAPAAHAAAGDDFPFNSALRSAVGDELPPNPLPKPAVKKVTCEIAVNGVSTFKGSMLPQPWPVFFAAASKKSKTPRHWRVFFGFDNVNAVMSVGIADDDHLLTPKPTAATNTARTADAPLPQPPAPGPNAEAASVATASGKLIPGNFSLTSGDPKDPQDDAVAVNCTIE